VRLTVLIVAEDSLDPAKCLQARRKIKGLPGLSTELGELSGPRRAAAILPRRSSTSASKTKGKVKIAGAPAVLAVLIMPSKTLPAYTHCSIHTSDLGGSTDHERKLTKRLDGLQRFEQRLDQRSRSMIVTPDLPRAG
jgi:hypothetical protein